MQQQFKIFDSIEDAYKLLQDLDAPSHLIPHVKLVAEAGEILISQFQQLNISFDPEWIRLGVAFHDTGKILYPEHRTISKAAQILNQDYWDIFVKLDDLFEEIARDGDIRLSKSTL